jgi:hypothetical protein
MARSRRAKPEGAAPDDVVRHALNETLAGWQEHGNRQLRFNRAYQIWRGTAGNRLPAQQRVWDSRMRIKYGMQVVDQTMVNVVQGVPQARCTPRRPQDEDAAKAMEQILGYYTDLDHLAESEPTIVQQALVYGVSPAKNVWLYREKDVVRGWNPQAEGGKGRWEPGTVRVVQDDRPTLIPWDAYDCWWEPLAPDPDRAAYIVLREYASKDSLEERRYNPDSKVGMLKNLDLLYQSGRPNTPQPTAQNSLLGYPQGEMYQNRFEIWEIWRDDRLTIIGNRTILLYDGPKPYWMPGKPVVIGNSRPDFLRIEGISETELVDDIQQALWTHENLVMENLKMTVMRGATVRETVPDIAQLVLRPNYLWPVTDHDDVHFQDPPAMAPEAYEQRSTLLGAMQYVTGITTIVSGQAQNPGADTQTATGISTLSGAASKLLEFKARLIALRVYQRSYEQWKDLAHQFVSEPMSVKLSGKAKADNLAQGGNGWADYGPQNIYGDYDVRVRAGEESLNRAQKRADAIQAANALAPYIQVFPGLAKPIIEQIGDAYGWEDIDQILDQVQQPQPAQAPLPAAPAPQQLNGSLVPHPALSVLAGNAR